MEAQVPHPRPHGVEITVNKQPVRLPSAETTGLAIKKAAIAQGVSIKLEHVLFVIRGNKQIPVADDEAIKVHEREQFRAVASDDNS